MIPMLNTLIWGSSNNSFQGWIPFWSGERILIYQSYRRLEERCVLVVFGFFLAPNLKTNLSQFGISYVHAHLLVNGSLNSGLHRFLWLIWYSLGAQFGLNVLWHHPSHNSSWTSCFMHRLSFPDHRAVFIHAPCAQIILSLVLCLA